MRAIQVVVVLAGVLAAVGVVLRGREHRPRPVGSGTAAGPPDPGSPTDRRPSAVATELADDRTHQFRPERGGYIRCLTCGGRVSAEIMGAADGRYRVEGVTDPDEMHLVVGITCPECRTTGSLNLSCGPTASPEESDVLSKLGPVDRSAE